MKLHYISKKILLLSCFSFLFIASSCVIYQNSPDDDGIYSSRKKEEPRVIIADSEEHKQYEENYFSKELEKLQELDSDDIFTDVDDYSSIVTISNSFENNIQYNNSGSWGYGGSNDVVVQLNLGPRFYNPYWFNDFLYWDSFYWSPYYYTPGLYWGWRSPRWRFWYHRPHAFGYAYWNRPYWRNNRYYRSYPRNYRYGKRNVDYRYSRGRNYASSTR